MDNCIAPNLLCKLLSYNADTGELRWKSRPKEMFSRLQGYARWNNRYANTEAFTSISQDGYRKGKILDRDFIAHRVIWAMQTGAWPPDGMEVDHINGIRDDNRWSNLRVATVPENRRNKCTQSNNTSGYTGVYPIGSSGKWRARLQRDGKLIHLGTFGRKEDAHDAFMKAARRLHANFYSARREYYEGARP